MLDDGQAGELPAEDAGFATAARATPDEDIKQASIFQRRYQLKPLYLVKVSWGPPGSAMIDREEQRGPFIDFAEAFAVLAIVHRTGRFPPRGRGRGRQGLASAGAMVDKAHELAMVLSEL